MLIATHNITLTQFSFHNHYLGCPTFHPFFSVKLPNYPFLLYKERWVSLKNGFYHLGGLNFHPGHRKNGFYHLGNLNFHLSHQDRIFIVNSNLTLEAPSSVDNNEDKLEDIEDLDEREKLRRLRISKANKGNTPWNKGRKHSPETLQRIRERTRLAMQNPKVKMKLANLGHAQSEETKEKIAAGVRLGWQRRREKLMLQETCLFDWQNLIAESSRRGFLGEEELQWNSYELLSEQLQQEWLNSIELRKSKPRPKGSKRAPKSLEQRRKIAEAIAAKWADPDYRTRVCSALAKYHGTPEGAARKPRRKSSSEPGAPRAPRKKVTDAERSAENTAVVQQSKLKKKTAPKYKDPLASYKLEMLKSIRAQRMPSESKKIEALQRAKLLIAEAEKAAKALEVAAAKSPVAQASLIESRKLIAEAIQSIESIHINMNIASKEDVPSEQVTFAEKREEPFNQNTSQLIQNGNGMNGVASIQSSKNLTQDFDLYEFTMLDKMDANYQVSMLSGYDLPNLDARNFMGKSDSSKVNDQQHMKLNGATRLNGSSSTNGAQLQTQKEAPGAKKTVTKKWVRGRLVEVAELEVNA